VNVSKDFEELFALLAKHRVEFVIVGGYAVTFHTKPRYTKDIDILVRCSVENSQRLIGALGEFGFGNVGLTEADFQKDDAIIQLGRAPNRIDILTRIAGVPFDRAWKHRCPGKFGAAEVNYIGRAELILNKETVGRPQDLIDVTWLKRGKP
jgi:hypothetical protein